MVFNNETDRPASYNDSSSNESSNLVRLVEDPKIEKTIRFDEISLPNVPDTKDGLGGNSKVDELGLVYPIIRINDVIVARWNLASLNISMSGFMPTIRLSIMNQDSAFISKNMPKDGDIVSIFVRSSTAALSYLRDDFIITSCDVRNGKTGSSSNRITISGRLFISGFDSQNTTNAFIGTSKDVMKETAKNYGIGFSFNDYDDTDDYQLWIRYKETGEVFLSNVAMHSWKDDISFFKSWIDLYYDLCYVNINKFLLSDQNNEDIDVTFSSKIIDIFNEVNNDASVGSATMAIKILTNSADFKGTPFYVTRWDPVNMSSMISLSNGYSTTSYTYVHNQNIINSGDSDCFEILNNIPAYDQTKTDSFILLRGRARYDKEKNPDDEQARVNYNFVDTYTTTSWTGIEYAMSDDDKNQSPEKWSGNVHKNYNRSPYHNAQNINELNKMYLNVTCEGLNLQIMKGERIPLLIVFANSADNDVYNATGNDNLRSVNRFYSGYYLVDSIEYNYKPNRDESITPWTTSFTLKRREWPTPEAISENEEE